MNHPAIAWPIKPATTATLTTPVVPDNRFRFESHAALGAGAGMSGSRIGIGQTYTVPSAQQLWAPRPTLAHDPRGEIWSRLRSGSELAAMVRDLAFGR